MRDSRNAIAQAEIRERLESVGDQRIAARLVTREVVAIDERHTETALRGGNRGCAASGPSADDQDIRAHSRSLDPIAADGAERGTANGGKRQRFSITHVVMQRWA
jgi:hypothetical protein